MATLGPGRNFTVWCILRALNILWNVLEGVCEGLSSSTSLLCGHEVNSLFHTKFPLQCATSLEGQRKGQTSCRLELQKLN